MQIAEKFRCVKYISSRTPGVENESDLTLGANCQLFAYILLRHFGLNPPSYRSSELWADDEFTKVVTEFSALDIMLYNHNDESFGAHVGMYVGEGLVYHLSYDNGEPKYEKHTDLLKQQKYRVFIGAKRVTRLCEPK